MKNTLKNEFEPLALKVWFPSLRGIPTGQKILLVKDVLEAIELFKKDMDFAPEFWRKYLKNRFGELK